MPLGSAQPARAGFRRSAPEVGSRASLLAARLSRFAPPLAGGLLALVLCAGLRWSAERAQQLFQAGNVLSTNHLSQIGSIQVEQLLGHAQLLLLGTGMLALLELGRLWRPGGVRSPGAVARCLPPGLGLLALAALGSYAIWQQSTVIDGVRLFYLKDDALTSLVYARHLLEGQGLVYNAGERVEGYTNLLWVLWMAMLQALGAGTRAAPFWVLVSSWLCVLCSVCCSFKLLRALKLSQRWAAVCALCVAFDQNTWTWAVSGLETSALTAAVCVSAWGLVCDRRGVVAVALALLALLRSDGFLLAGVFAAFAFWYWRAGAGSRRNWAAARPLLPALLVTLAVFAFRFVYYGYAFPNTYYLKMIELGDRLRVGLGGYGLRLAEGYALFLALALGVALSRRTPALVRGLALLCWFQISYAIYLGGDIFRHLRFVAPVLPLTYAMATFALRQLLEQASSRAASLGRALCLASCCVPCESGQLGRLPDESGFFQSEFSLARLIERNVPKGALITVYPAGTLAYYAPGYRYLDVFGKTDAHIAHLSQYQGTAIGHNKSDFDYVYAQRQPDVALVASSCDVIDEYLAADHSERERMRVAYSIDGTPVRFFDMGHPLFVRDYYPLRVRYAGYPSPTPPECVFVRQGSGMPTLWQLPAPLSSVAREHSSQPPAARAR